MTGRWCALCLSSQRACAVQERNDRALVSLMGSSMRHRSKFAELLATRKQKQAEQAGSLTRRWFVTEDLWMAGTAAVAEAQAEQVTDPPL